ncbi:MAG: EamA family transporter [Candidatus Zixiibacteriota bacterium]|nr:MAG: EamA family transporter [candidate division Zixibacteria bacterium]
MRWSSMYLLISVLFWGISYIAIKVVLKELEPVEMISIRFLLAAPTLYIIIKFKRLSMWPLPMKGKLIFAAFVVFMHFWVMATGMKETSASNTAWILTTAPIFIALLSWMYLKEKFNLPQWFGLALAVAGVFALVYNGNPKNLGWIHTRGDVIVLGSCVTWAIYTVGTRELTARINPLVATFWMVVIAGLVFIPWTFITSGYQKFLNLETNTVISLVFLGIFCLAIAFWLWSEGLAKQTAAEVGVYLYVEPLVTMIGAWVLLGERITIWLIIGAILISIGVWVSERHSKMQLQEHDV